MKIKGLLFLCWITLSVNLFSQFTYSKKERHKRVATIQVEAEEENYFLYKNFMIRVETDENRYSIKKYDINSLKLEKTA